MLRLGGHLSIAGGYDKALDRSVAIGGNSLQIFAGSPRLWKRPQVDTGVIDRFKTKSEQLDIKPIFFHASYLVNLAALNDVADKSIEILVWELKLASQLGIVGSVVHLGSFLKHDPQVAYPELIKNISRVLDQSPSTVSFIIENSAGNKVGRSLAEIFRIIKDLKDNRVKLCWDTCHGFAAGIDLASKDKLDRFLDQINSNVGLDRLVLWHFNDSKDPFNSGRDRHANIGEGYLGLATFRTIINHPIANQKPMIIETPGFDNQGPDKKNLDLLKSLIVIDQPVNKKTGPQECKEVIV